MVQTIIEEFTTLNEGLKSKLTEIESSGPALSLGQRVMSDPDLQYLVESIWFKSEFKREQLRRRS